MPPIAGASYVIADKLVSAYARGPSPTEIGDRIAAEWTKYCVPEPREQMGYVLAVVLPVLLLLIGTFGLKALGVFRRSESTSPWLTLVALGTQLAMVIMGVTVMGFQDSDVYHFRFLSSTRLMSTVLVLGCMLAYPVWGRQSLPFFRAIWQRLQGIRWLAWLLAMTWIVVFAMPGIYRQTEIPSATEAVRAHFPYTMGEYAAALNGRTALVDFFSQYQNLQALLVAPFFKVTGFGAGAFTAMMAALTCIGFGLLFASLSKICKGAWAALILFVPLVAFAFYSEDVGPNNLHTNTFNYYATGPIRYFGTCLLAWVAVWYLGKPKGRRLLVAAAVSLLVALNNLDFGLPAAVGVLACVLLFPPQLAGARLAMRIMGAGLLYLMTALATLGIYCLCIRVATGFWPLLGQLVVYQKAFALLGFYMKPMPKMGLHWIVYLTAMSAVALAIYETFTAVHSTIAHNRRLINGSLAYSGIAAFGPITYYAGRSHALVLEVTFLWWAYLLAQLVNRAWQHWREVAQEPGKSHGLLLAIPSVATFALFILVSSTVAEVPNPVAQVWRLTAKPEPAQSPDASFIKLVQRYVRPGEKTVIAYRDAHWLALQAGVTNLFPFAHLGSLLLKDQVNAAMAAVAALPRERQYVFGNPIPEWRDRLMENGFKRVEGIVDFDVWVKEPP